MALYGGARVPTASPVAMGNLSSCGDAGAQGQSAETPVTMQWRQLGPRWQAAYAAEGGPDVTQAPWEISKRL